MTGWFVNKSPKNGLIKAFHQLLIDLNLNKFNKYSFKQ